MAKTCPSCGYKPIGPFTDNCPICAEPVRNVRSESAGPGWAFGLPIWGRWVLGLAAALILGVGGCCGVGMWRMSSALQDVRKAIEQAKVDAEADRKARTVVVAAAEILQEFQMDHAAADQKYKGKCLELTGIVERSGRNEGGAAFVILHGGDENAPIKIECFFDFADAAEQARRERLETGQPITLRGEYNGRVSHVQLRSCCLIR